MHACSYHCRKKRIIKKTEKPMLNLYLTFPEKNKKIKIKIKKQSIQ
jgi:hypothetical protein